VLWVAVGIFWVAFLVGFYVVCKPRFEAIERQRDVERDHGGQPAGCANRPGSPAS
jgi:hypothetical protein